MGMSAFKQLSHRLEQGIPTMFNKSNDTEHQQQVATPA